MHSIALFIHKNQRKHFFFFFLMNRREERRAPGNVSGYETSAERSWSRRKKKWGGCHGNGWWCNFPSPVFSPLLWGGQKETVTESSWPEATGVAFHSSRCSRNASKRHLCLFLFVLCFKSTNARNLNFSPVFQKSLLAVQIISSKMCRCFLGGIMGQQEGKNLHSAAAEADFCHKRAQFSCCDQKRMKLFCYR